MPRITRLNKAIKEQIEKLFVGELNLQYTMTHRDSDFERARGALLKIYSLPAHQEDREKLVKAYGEPYIVRARGPQEAVEILQSLYIPDEIGWIKSRRTHNATWSSIIRAHNPYYHSQSRADQMAGPSVRDAVRHEIAKHFATIGIYQGLEYSGKVKIRPEHLDRAVANALRCIETSSKFEIPQSALRAIESSIRSKGYKEFSGILASSSSINQVVNGGPTELDSALGILMLRALCTLSLTPSWKELQEVTDLYWNCSQIICNASTIIIVDKPAEIHTQKPRPSRNWRMLDLHRVGGPAVVYPNGEEYFFIKDVRVNEQIAVRAHEMTADSIAEIENSEVRRVAIEMYGGEEKFIKDMGSELIHADEFGELFGVKIAPEQHKLFVAVVCPSTGRVYTLDVHPQLRPMISTAGDPSRTRLGPAQELTARNAVASTFGMTGEEYAPEQES